MTPAELERANTWLIEIVDTLIDGVQWRQEGNEHHVVGQGGLSVNTLKGCGFQLSTYQGGCSTISLVKLLKDCDDAAATEWLDIFLRAHPGTGSITAPEDDEHEIESAAQAQDIVDKLVDPVGPPAETYLQWCGIAGPIPEFVKYLPHSRCGEGAIAGLLKVRGRIVGVQVGYREPDGRKTIVPPYRRQFILETAPDAVFNIPKPNAATDMLGDTLVIEGLEDALSLVELNRAMRIVGLPGVGTLTKLPAKKGEHHFISEYSHRLIGGFNTVESLSVW